MIVTKEQIGTEFAKVLYEWLTDEEWNEMCVKNRDLYKGTSVCASHDYCDANMAMLEAFQNLGIIAPVELSDNVSEDHPDLDNVSCYCMYAICTDAKHLDLWNDSWDWAKQNLLTKNSEKDK